MPLDKSVTVYSVLSVYDCRGSVRFSANNNAEYKIAHQLQYVSGSAVHTLNGSLYYNRFQINSYSWSWSVFYITIYYTEFLLGNDLEY